MSLYQVDVVIAGQDLFSKVVNREARDLIVSKAQANQACKSIKVQGMRPVINGRTGQGEMRLDRTKVWTWNRKKAQVVAEAPAPVAEKQPEREPMLEDTGKMLGDLPVMYCRKAGQGYRPARFYVDGVALTITQVKTLFN